MAAVEPAPVDVAPFLRMPMLNVEFVLSSYSGENQIATPFVPLALRDDAFVPPALEDSVPSNRAPGRHASDASESSEQQRVALDILLSHGAAARLAFAHDASSTTPSLVPRSAAMLAGAASLALGGAGAVASAGLELVSRFILPFIPIVGPPLGVATEAAVSVVGSLAQHVGAAAMAAGGAAASAAGSALHAWAAPARHRAFLAQLYRTARVKRSPSAPGAAARQAAESIVIACLAAYGEALPARADLAACRALGAAAPVSPQATYGAGVLRAAVAAAVVGSTGAQREAVARQRLAVDWVRLRQCALAAALPALVADAAGLRLGSLSSSPASGSGGGADDDASRALAALPLVPDSPAVWGSLSVAVCSALGLEASCVQQASWLAAGADRPGHVMLFDGCAGEAWLIVFAARAVGAGELAAVLCASACGVAAEAEVGARALEDALHERVAALLASGACRRLTVVGAGLAGATAACFTLALRRAHPRGMAAKVCAVTFGCAPWCESDFAAGEAEAAVLNVVLPSDLVPRLQRSTVAALHAQLEQPNSARVQSDDRPSHGCAPGLVLLLAERRAFAVNGRVLLDEACLRPCADLASVAQAHEYLAVVDEMEEARAAD